MIGRKGFKVILILFFLLLLSGSVFAASSTGKAEITVKNNDDDKQSVTLYVNGSEEKSFSVKAGDEKTKTISGLSPGDYVFSISWTDDDTGVTYYKNETKTIKKGKTKSFSMTITAHYPEAKPKPELELFECPSSINANEKAEVRVNGNVKNGEAKIGYISVTVKNENGVEITKNNMSNEQISPAGSRIWDKDDGRFYSDYLLVDAWNEPWKKDDSEKLYISITPKGTKNITVWARATVTGPDGKKYSYPSSGDKDQQGWYAQKCVIEVKEVQVPPSPSLELFECPSSINANEKAEVKVKGNVLNGDAKIGYISVTVKNENGVEITQNNLGNSKISPAGAYIWKKDGSRFYSDYLLVDAWNEPWDKGDSEKLYISITPKDSKAITVWARVTATGHDDKMYSYPSSGDKDQQGWYAQQCVIEVKEVQLPPSPSLTVISMPESIYDDEKARIRVEAKNIGGKANIGYISISIENESGVEITKNNLGNELISPAGAYIWHKDGSRFYSTYLLVDAWKNDWKKDDAGFIEFEVKPKGMKNIYVNVRATFDNSINTPSNSSNIDQQGWAVDRREIKVYGRPCQTDLDCEDNNPLTINKCILQADSTHPLAPVCDNTPYLETENYSFTGNSLNEFFSSNKIAIIVPENMSNEYIDSLKRALVSKYGFKDQSLDMANYHLCNPPAGTTIPYYPYYEQFYAENCLATGNPNLVNEKQITVYKESEVDCSSKLSLAAKNVILFTNYGSSLMNCFKGIPSFDQPTISLWKSGWDSANKILLLNAVSIKEHESLASMLQDIVLNQGTWSQATEEATRLSYIDAGLGIAGIVPVLDTAVDAIFVFKDCGNAVSKANIFSSDFSLTYLKKAGSSCGLSAIFAAIPFLGVGAYKTATKLDKATDMLHGAASFAENTGDARFVKNLLGSNPAKINQAAAKTGVYYERFYKELENSVDYFDSLKTIGMSFEDATRGLGKVMMDDTAYELYKKSGAIVKTDLLRTGSNLAKFEDEIHWIKKADTHFGDSDLRAYVDELAPKIKEDFAGALNDITPGQSIARVGVKPEVMFERVGDASSFAYWNNKIHFIMPALVSDTYRFFVVRHELRHVLQYNKAVNAYTAIAEYSKTKVFTRIYPFLELNNDFLNIQALAVKGKAGNYIQILNGAVKNPDFISTKTIDIIQKARTDKRYWTHIALKKAWVSSAEYASPEESAKALEIINDLLRKEGLPNDQLKAIDDYADVLKNNYKRTDYENVLPEIDAAANNLIDKMHGTIPSGTDTLAAVLVPFIAVRYGLTDEAPESQSLESAQANKPNDSEPSQPDAGILTPETVNEPVSQPTPSISGTFSFKVIAEGTESWQKTTYVNETTSKKKCSGILFWKKCKNKTETVQVPKTESFSEKRTSESQAFTYTVSEQNTDVFLGTIAPQLQALNNGTLAGKSFALKDVSLPDGTIVAGPAANAGSGIYSIRIDVSNGSVYARISN